MESNKKMDRRTLLGVIYAMVVILTGISVAYAALSTTLNVTVNKVTQNALTWNVGFQTGTVPVTPGGEGSSVATCGAASVTASTVTVAESTLSKPNDSCTYTLTVKNTGGIDATLGTITPKNPESTSCTNSGASMVCGNITYKLTTDAAGTTLLTTGGTLAKTNGTQTIYLVVKYTGSGLVSNEIAQNSGGFSLVYNQQ